ncbi:hypothetical protein AB4218_23160 [Vibrio splendidus]
MNIKIETLMNNPQASLLTNEASCRSLKGFIQHHQKFIDDSDSKFTIKSFVSQYESEIDEILAHIDVVVYDSSKPITELEIITEQGVLSFDEIPESTSKKILEQLDISYVERSIELNGHREDFIAFVDKGDVLYKSNIDRICYECEDYKNSLSNNYQNTFSYFHGIEDFFEPYKKTYIDQNSEIYTLLFEQYSDTLPASDMYFIRDECVYNNRLESVYDFQFYVEEHDFSLADYVRGDARIKVAPAFLPHDLGVRWVGISELGTELKSTFKTANLNQEFTVTTDLENEYVFTVDPACVFESAVDSAYFSHEPENRDEVFAEQLKEFILKKRNYDYYSIDVKIKPSIVKLKSDYNRILKAANRHTNH